MRSALIISAIAHLVAIVLTITGLPWLGRQRVPNLEVIPVELVQAVEEKAKAPEAQPEKKPEPEAKKEPKPKPKPAPDTAAQPKTRPKPPTPPKPEAVPPPDIPKVTPEPRPKPPSRFDPKRLAALIDKEIKDKPKEVESEDKKLDVSRILKNASRSQLEQARLVAGLRDAIRSQVETCWNVPAGARYAEDLKVRIRIYLNPDGALARPPEILDTQKMNGPGGDFFRVAAESARRAVQRCAPLKLPRETYDIWRDIELTFDPSEMLGG